MELEFQNVTLATSGVRYVCFK